MNKVILMGRLTADPELRQTPAGVAVANITIAVDRRFSKEKEADFIRCTAWRNNAEFICKYFRKGNMIAVIGNIQTRSWEDDGKKQYATDIMVDEVYFCGSKNESTKSEPADEVNGFDAFLAEFDGNPFN